jgi:hypothetical protein
MYNVRGDKTHATGDGSHTGWIPARNVLLCPDVFLGTCLLYRFTQDERFPDVLAEDGMYYKWLPLVISTESTYAIDRKKALLALRGVDARTQNACFNQLYAVAGVEMYAGDAVTHAGRA